MCKIDFICVFSSRTIHKKTVAEGKAKKGQGCSTVSPKIHDKSQPKSENARTVVQSSLAPLS